MKNNPFKYFVFLMLSLLMVATTGCTEDDISMPAGQLPDETPMNSVGGQLCSGKTFSNKITVSMYEGDGACNRRDMLCTDKACYNGCYGKSHSVSGALWLNITVITKLI